MPTDAAVVDLQPQTDGSVLAKVEAHRDAVVVGSALRIIETPDGWKVGKP
jgi:hypothetical protein